MQFRFKIDGICTNRKAFSVRSLNRSLLASNSCSAFIFSLHLTAAPRPFHISPARLPARFLFIYCRKYFGTILNGTIYICVHMYLRRCTDERMIFILNMSVCLSLAVDCMNWRISLYEWLGNVYVTLYLCLCLAQHAAYQRE